jgi:transposase
MQCFPQNSATSSTRSEKCIVAALSWPQRERLDRYSGSGHSYSRVVDTRGGAASDLRLHLMWRALMQCFPPISTDYSARSEKRIAAALSWPQRERLDRYSGSGHS